MAWLVNQPYSRVYENVWKQYQAKSYEVFWTKNSILMDYKSRKIAGAFKGRYVEYKSGHDKNYERKDTLKKLDYTCVIL